jgi:dipeptidyl aminopeptidase/acylaminoacyl peptidase
MLADPTEPQARLPWAASPDGSTIAIVSGKGLWYQFKPPVSLALWLVGADGSNPRKVQDLLPPRGVDLTPGGDDAFNLVPALTDHQELAWSPDGQRVAFVSAHEDQVDLYTAALDGSITRLTNTPRLEQGPVWSPDGALVAYRTTTGFGTGAGWGEVAVEVAPRAGGAPAAVFGDRKLAAGTEAAAIPDLLWISPNIAVAGYWDSLVGNAEIRALDAAAGASQAIWSAPYSAIEWNATTGQLAIAGTPARLAASPIDQRKLAPGLYTWAPGTSQPTRIDEQPAEQLAWAPQGDALAYSVGGDRPAVRVWSIGAEGDIKPIANIAAQQLSWSLDGQLLAVERAIYSRAGAKLSDPPAANGAQIGWLPQGLVYSQLSGGEAYDLMLWEGAAARPMATNVSKPAAAEVVNSIH